MPLSFQAAQETMALDMRVWHPILGSFVLLSLSFLCFSEKSLRSDLKARIKYRVKYRRKERHDQESPGISNTDSQGGHAG